MCLPHAMMKEPAGAHPGRRYRRRPAALLIWACVLVPLLAFLLSVHPFLAINAPVQADTLVIEGWVPDYVVDRAVAEIARGGYSRVFVSGMESDSAQSMSVVRRLVRAGIDPDRVVPAPAPEAGFRPRTWRGQCAIACASSACSLAASTSSRSGLTPVRRASLMRDCSIRSHRWA